MRAMRRHLLILTLLLAPSVAAAAGAAPRVVAKIHVGSQPCAGVAAFGSFWQTNYGTATLSRVNPRTNKVTRTGRLGAQPCGIAAGAGSLWIDGYGTSTRRARQPAHAQGRQANPRRRQRLGRRVRVRLGLGVEQLRRLGLADQPGHQSRRQDDQDRRPAQQLRGRRGRALGRLERDVGPGRLPNRPGDEHVDRGARRTRQPERDHCLGGRGVDRQRWRRHGDARRPEHARRSSPR